MSGYKQLHYREVTATYPQPSTGQTWDEHLGDIRQLQMQSTGLALFRFVQAKVDTLSVGELVAFHDSNATAFTVHASSTSAEFASRPAGMAVSSIAVDDGGWVQIEGPPFNDLNTDGNVTADSDLFLSSAQAGRVTQDEDGVRVGTAFQADSADSVLAASTAVLKLPFH